MDVTLKLSPLILTAAGMLAFLIDFEDFETATVFFLLLVTLFDHWQQGKWDLCCLLSVVCHITPKGKLFVSFRCKIITLPFTGWGVNNAHKS